jgi:hypothetical protein
MTMLASVRGSLSARTATTTRERTGPREHVVRPAHRRPVHADGRRPARLMAAPFRSTAQSCEPRPAGGALGWLVLVAGLAFVVVLGIGWAMGGQDAASVPARTVLVQVHQGESLWGMAQRMAPSSSAAAVVTKIKQLNGLDDDSVLFPGELLQVPNGLSADAATKAGAIRP